MKFKLNTEVFLNAVTPVSVIARNNGKKVKTSQSSGVSSDDNALSITATAKELIINSCSDSARIAVRLKDSEGYLFEQTGKITVNAKELLSALKSCSVLDNLFVSVEDGNLKIAAESNNEVFIDVQGISKKNALPLLPAEYKQQVTVNKSYFIKGMEKAEYAQAFEEHMFSYMCVQFESSKNELKFVSGSGGRFVAIKFDGDTKNITTGEMKLLFPKTNVSNIVRIFKKSSGSTLKITSYGSDNIRNIREQIVLDDGNIVLCVYDLEHFTKYPETEDNINKVYPYQISTRVKDWKCISESIAASNLFCKENIHNTKVVADLNLGHFDVTTNTKMKMNRRVNFAPRVFVTDSNLEKTIKPWFCVNSFFLSEITTKWNKEEFVIFSFENQSVLDDIPDGEKKIWQNILLKFPEKTNKDGVKEKAVVFFTVSSKW